MRKAKAGIILALLVAAGLGIGYLAENPSRQTATSTSTSQQTTVSTSIEESSATSSAAISTVSSSGLELRVDLNATAMEPGQILAANVTLFNTLNENLSLGLVSPPNFNSSISSWDNYDFLCGSSGPVSYLASFALLKGHFSASNVSQAPAPLQLAAVADLPSCGGFVFPEDELVTFSPDSSEVMIPGSGALSERATLNVTTVSCIALPPGNSLCHGDAGLFGYWNTTDSICCPTNSDNPQYFRYFTPGAYTLVAEDLWNQTVYAYFRVAQSPSAAVVSAEESPLLSGSGAPVIGLTLANFADVPITSLNATLRFVPPPGSSASSASYPFAFNVNLSSPLSPGQTVEDVETLHGDLFDTGVSYPLTISGTLTNGTDFAYTQQVRFVSSVPS